MTYRASGRILKGVGGLYTVRLAAGDDPLAGRQVECRARGVLRHNRETPLVGDLVDVSYDDTSFFRQDGEVFPVEDGRAMTIDGLLPRRNALIRPPLANVDVMFVSMAAASPEPMPDVVDKLLAILEFNHIEPVVVIEKCELDRARAAELAAVYTLAGYRVFSVSCRLGEGIEALETFVRDSLGGKIAAFAGASGVGKSTLMNTLFPSLLLDTSDVSRKTERGRNTTRHVQLYPLSDAPEGGYLADTPGFSILDFERFDFFGKDDLPHVMREFEPYLGQCRYTKCTHTKEEGCAILAAVGQGRIAPSRHASYVALYDVLKRKKDWNV